MAEQHPVSPRVHLTFPHFSISLDYIICESMRNTGLIEKIFDTIN